MNTTIESDKWIQFSRSKWEKDPHPKVCRARDSRCPASVEWVSGTVEYVYANNRSPFLVVIGNHTDCYDVCEVLANGLKGEV